MRAVKIKGTNQLEVAELDKPQADGQNVIVKINACGICGSDLSMWHDGDQHKGLVMGHEFSGVVADPGASDLKVGDRVTAIPLDPCNKCPSCKDGLINICPTTWDKAPGLGSPGAYAEYTKIRPDMIRKLPDTINDVEATMIEPAAVTLRAVRLGQIGVGDKVLVTGAGIIGLLSAAWAKLEGASYVAIMETNPLRRKKALELGDVDAVFDGSDPEVVTQMVNATHGGFNKYIDCAGVAAAVNPGLTACVPGAKVIFVGVAYEPQPISTMLIILRGYEVFGTIAYTVGEFELCIDILAQKKLNLERFVSSVIGFEGVQSAFEKLKSGGCGDVKILLEP